MKRIFTLILCVAVFGWVSAQDQPTYTAKTTGMTPVADGYIDDVDDPWAEDAWEELPDAGGDTGDAFTGQFQILHVPDASMIWVAVKVQDDTPNWEHETSYMRDNTEIFFAMPGATDDGAYADGSWQFRAQRGETDDATFGYFTGNSGANTWSVAPMTDSEAFMWGTDDSGSEYVWELGFPMDVLLMGTEIKDDTYRFDISLGDNSDGSGRSGQRFWKNDGDVEWNNSTVFGNVVISAETPTGAEELSVQGSAFINGDMLNIRNVEGTVNVYNLKGSLVRSVEVEGNATVDVADLNSGMYIVKGANLAAKVVK